MSRIAVIPFQIVIPEDASAKTIRCPLSGTIFRTCKSSEGAEKVVEKIFLRKLKDCRQFILIPTDRAGGVYRRISINSLKVTPLAILRKVGKELDADGVVAGYVYRYRERKGYPYSAEKPASVAFGIYLIRVSDGTLVWRGVFDRTQRTLLENILQVSSFFKQGGRWITAEELSKVGIDEILKTFPDLQQGEK
ncbi:MAG: hypothetical protein U9M96_02525 [Thermodesulfobacteriota bacterium]|nr:hypothetical protein [Thermodesulfobacteriota bacterium]